MTEPEMIDEVIRQIKALSHDDLYNVLKEHGLDKGPITGKLAGESSLIR